MYEFQIHCYDIFVIKRLSFASAITSMKHNNISQNYTFNEGVEKYL